MTWHTPPHLPEPGARIIVKFNGCKIGNYFDYTVREHEGLGHIEKWCYYEDYQQAIQRKLVNFKGEQQS